MTQAASPVAPVLESDPTWPSGARVCYPASVITPYQVANSDPTTLDSTPQRVDSLISGGGAKLIPIKMAGCGTSVQFTIQYDPSSAHTSTTSAVLWAIGVDKNGVAWRLLDSTGAKAWTMAPDASNDCANSANQYFMAPITVDASGAERVFIIVQTAAAGTMYTQAAPNASAVLAHVL